MRYMTASKLDKFAEELLYFWWVILVLILCLAFYEYEQKQRHLISSVLESKVQALQQEKLSASERYRRLSMEIDSQSDSHWIEMLLIKQLGLTPEGQTKVFFSEKNH